MNEYDRNSIKLLVKEFIAGISSEADLVSDIEHFAMIQRGEGYIDGMKKAIQIEEHHFLTAGRG